MPKQQSLLIFEQRNPQNPASLFLDSSRRIVDGTNILDITQININQFYFDNSNQISIGMFWQGGGKKRLKHQIENIMEIAQPHIQPNAIGKNDDQLLLIYYYRNADHSPPTIFSHSAQNASLTKGKDVAHSGVKENKDSNFFRKVVDSSSKKSDFR